MRILKLLEALLFAMVLPFWMQKAPQQQQQIEAGIEAAIGTNLTKNAKLFVMSNDIMVLKEIAKVHPSISTDWTSDQYEWSTNGRLVAIDWQSTKAKLSGKLSLKGLSALEKLDCCYNELMELDVSHNPELKRLQCHKSNLRSLDVSHNPELKVLHCSGNELGTLDVSHNPKLESLACSGCGLDKLDVSQNLKLEYLYCGWNDLEELDVSQNLKLNSLGCQNNKLEELDVSRNPQLEWLRCKENKLSKLNVSNNPKLEILQCYYTKLDSLDVSQNPNLKELCVDKDLPVTGDLSSVSVEYIDEGYFGGTGEKFNY